MNNYVITITRQFGSLGRPIAAKLAEILEIEYYDRDIVEQAARKMGGNLREISEQEEKAATGFARMKQPFGISTSEMQDEIFEKEKNIIESYAVKQSCIIVGRCADYVLREQKNALHIFIYAPKEARLRNCIETLHMERREALDTIREVDKMRDAYHRRYAGYLPADPLHKQLMIDSSLLGVEGTAKYLAEFVRQVFSAGESI